MTVFELHIYEPLKKVWLSNYRKHDEDFRNDIPHCHRISTRLTHRSNQKLAQTPPSKSKIIKQIIKYWGSVLYNALTTAAILPQDVNAFQTDSDLISSHKKNSFILNIELVG